MDYGDMGYDGYDDLDDGYESPETQARRERLRNAAYRIGRGSRGHGIGRGHGLGAHGHLGHGLHGRGGMSPMPMHGHGHGHGHGHFHGHGYGRVHSRGHGHGHGHGPTHSPGRGMGSPWQGPPHMSDPYGSVQESGMDSSRAEGGYGRMPSPGPPQMGGRPVGPSGGEEWGSGRGGFNEPGWGSGGYDDTGGHGASHSTIGHGHGHHRHPPSGFGDGYSRSSARLPQHQSSHHAGSRHWDPRSGTSSHTLGRSQSHSHEHRGAWGNDSWGQPERHSRSGTHSGGGYESDYDY